MKSLLGDIISSIAINRNNYRGFSLPKLDYLITMDKLNYKIYKKLKLNFKIRFILKNLFYLSFKILIYLVNKCYFDV